MNIEEIATSLVSWESNGLNKNTAKMAFLKASEELDKQTISIEDKDLVLKDISTRIKQDIVKEGTEGEFKFSSDASNRDIRDQKAFGGWLEVKSGQLTKREQAKLNSAKATLAINEVGNTYGDLLNTIDSGSPDSGDMLDAFMGNAEVQLREKGGLSDLDIENQLNKYELGAGEATFNVLNRNNPESALQFAEDNAELFGGKVLGLKNKARRALKKQQADALKSQIEVAKEGFQGFNLDQISEMTGSSEEAVAKAARKTLREASQDPIKLVEKDLNPLNTNDKSTLETRIAFIEDSEASYDSPNHPIDIPYLTKKNVKSLRDKMLTGGATAQKTLDFLSLEDGAESLKLSKSFGKDPIGQAVRLYKSDPRTSLNVIEGLNSFQKPSISAADIAFDVKVYSNPALNTSAIKAMEALSRVEDGLSSTELAEKIVNLQDTNPGFFSFERLLPVPFGFSGEEFENRVSEVLADPKMSRKYSNGEMLGGDVDIDYDDVTFEAISPGVYALKKDDKYLITQDGDKYVMNLGRALEDG